MNGNVTARVTMKNIKTGTDEPAAETLAMAVLFLCLSNIYRFDVASFPFCYNRYFFRPLARGQLGVPPLYALGRSVVSVGGYLSQKDI
jgi:hypothetical protein